MSWRGVAPVQLVICFVGGVLILCVGGIIGLAIFGRAIPDELGTVCIASMTALAGLLAPNTGLVSSRTSRRATEAAHAAAAAVVEVDGAADQHSAELDRAVELGNSHDENGEGGRHL